MPPQLGDAIESEDPVSNPWGGYGPLEGSEMPMAEPASRFFRVVLYRAHRRACRAGVDEVGTDLVCIRPIEGVGRDAEPGGGAEGVVEVPTTDAPNLQQALMEGTLRGDADDQCLWVEATGEGERMPVVWPPGYGARFDAGGIELVDESGVVVAHDGDAVALGGGVNPVDPAGECMFGEDSAWVAGSVERDG
jgi:hypothetical protein